MGGRGRSVVPYRLALSSGYRVQPNIRVPAYFVLMVTIDAASLEMHLPCTRRLTCGIMSHTCQAASFIEHEQSGWRLMWTKLTATQLLVSAWSGKTGA